MSNDNTAAYIPLVIGLMVLAIAGVFFAIAATVYYFIIRLRWTIRYSTIFDLTALVGLTGYVAAQNIPAAFAVMGDDIILGIIEIAFINLPIAFTHLWDTIFPPSKRKIEWIDMAHLQYDAGEITAQERKERINHAKNMSNKKFEAFVYNLQKQQSQQTMITPEPVPVHDEFSGETAADADYFRFEEKPVKKDNSRFDTDELCEKYEKAGEVLLDPHASQVTKHQAFKFRSYADGGKVKGIKPVQRLIPTELTTNT